VTTNIIACHTMSSLAVTEWTGRSYIHFFRSN